MDLTSSNYVVKAPEEAFKKTQSGSIEIELRYFG